MEVTDRLKCLHFDLLSLYWYLRFKSLQPPPSKLPPTSSELHFFVLVFRIPYPPRCRPSLAFPIPRKLRIIASPSTTRTFGAIVVTQAANESNKTVEQEKILVPMRLRLLAAGEPAACQ